MMKVAEYIIVTKHFKYIASMQGSVFAILGKNAFGEEIQKMLILSFVSKKKILKANLRNHV